MKYFFDPVMIFNTTGKTAKGKALQEMAMRLEHLLVEREHAPEETLLALSDQAKAIDERYSRGLPTMLHFYIDPLGDFGQISATTWPSAANAGDGMPYFRIHFRRVERQVSAQLLGAMVKGGAQ